MLGHTPPCILVIDPDPGQQPIIAHLVYPHYKVLWCGTFADAYGLLRSYHPRLLLLDIDQPSENPFSWMQRQRTSQHQNALPMVCTSAQSQITDKILAFQNGADDVWVKPFAPATLLPRMELLIRTAAIQRGT